MDRQPDDRSAVEETATTGRPGEPPPEGGIGSDPLRPSERETYGTGEAGGEGSVEARSSSPPGIVVALVLLAIFLVILAWAVLVAFR